MRSPSTRDLTPKVRSLYPITKALGLLGVNVEDPKKILCFVHDDHTPSGNIHENTFRCHVCNSTWDSIGVCKRAWGLEYGETIRRMAAEVGLSAAEPAITKTYDYLRIDGTLAYQVVRLEPGYNGQPKTFRQRRPWLNGKWAWGLTAGNYTERGGDLVPFKTGSIPLPAVDRILYRLPELLSSSGPVYICEGEKDVDRLRSLGLTATTNTGGAGKWKQEFSKLLAGRTVYVIEDNDEPGRKHAASILETLPDAKILRLPGLPEKGDVSDWLDAGGSVSDLPKFAILRATPEPKPVSDADLIFTDAGIADLFEAKHAQDVRFISKTGTWYVWDGKRWVPDEDLTVFRMMATVVREVYLKVQDEPADLGRAAKLESAGKIQGAMAHAGSRVGISCKPSHFDADPWILTVRNGTLNLRSGELRPHSRDDRTTKIIDLDYNPSAPCPRFLRFLSEVMAGDQEMVTLLRRWFGYCLTADTTEHVVLFLTGTGRNGKGALIRAVQNVYGPLAGTAPEGLLTVSRFERHPAELEVLRNRRLVVASELPKTAIFNEARLKQLTGGDVIVARGMRENFAEMIPTAKILVMANHKPGVADESPAFWERMRVVPFPVSFAGREDRSLDRDLLSEAPGILAWMVKGCLEWQRERLPKPAAVVRATAEYRQNENHFGRFVDGFKTENGVERIRDIAASEFLRAYNEIAQVEDWPTLTPTKFGKLLKEAGWKSSRLRDENGKLFRSWTEPEVCDTLTLCDASQGLPAPESNLATIDPHAPARTPAHAHAQAELLHTPTCHNVSRVTNHFTYDPDEAPDDES